MPLHVFFFRWVFTFSPPLKKLDSFIFLRQKHILSVGTVILHISMYNIRKKPKKPTWSLCLVDFGQLCGFYSYNWHRSQIKVNKQVCGFPHLSFLGCIRYRDSNINSVSAILSFTFLCTYGFRLNLSHRRTENQRYISFLK